MILPHFLITTDPTSATHQDSHCNSLNQSGFTLIEVVASMVVLAIALTTLVGIQSNYVEAYLAEESRSSAAMYAQYILSSIEVQPEPPDSGQTSGSLESYLKKLGFFDADFSEEDVGGLEGWNYKVDSSNFPLPGLEGDMLRKILLTISWGPSELEQFDIVYYMKNPPKL